MTTSDSFVTNINICEKQKYLTSLLINNDVIFRNVLYVKGLPHEFQKPIKMYWLTQE